MRLAVIAALLLTACGGTRQPLAPAGPAAVPADELADDGTPQAPPVGAAAPSEAAAAPVVAAPVKPQADTPMCRQFKVVVALAE